MKQKAFLKILFALLVVIMVYSCKKSPVCDCFEVTGNQATDDRTSALAYFNQVVTYDDMNIFISIGPQEKVLISGGENLIRNISANATNGILSLRNENNCNWLRSYKKSTINIYITMPEVTYITNNGYGTIQSTDTIAADNLQVQTYSAGDIHLAVHCNSINAHLFGSSDVTLSGTCGAFECNFFAGTGFLYADHLATGYTYLTTSTTGDCYVNSNGGLDVVINKQGNIYYAGNPISINKKIHGAGQLIKE
jgi:hypothetical protein